MVKKTINFHNPEVLTNFDERIKKDFGSIRGNRTIMLEKLMNEYTSGEYDEKNKELIELKQRVSDYTPKYQSLLKENKTLSEENKKMKDDIDELTQHIESLESKLKELQTSNEHLDKMLSERSERISEYKVMLSDKDDDIKSLNKKITSKENDYKHLEEVRNKDLKEKDELNNKIGRYSYVIGYIENMSLLDRIRKKYPEEMKALPSTK